MLTAKMLYNTYAHKQMRMYIDQEYAQLPHWMRSQKLGQLTKKFLHNFADQFRGDQDLVGVPGNIDEAFTWEDTPEGHEFWKRICGMMPEEGVMAAPKRAKVAKAPAPKKKVGWW
jgi:hypothetical protein